MVGGNNDRRAERNEITMKWLRAEVALGGLNEIHGDLILDKSFFAPTLGGKSASISPDVNPRNAGGVIAT